MEDWITGHKLPLGWAVKQFIAWLQTHASWFFDLITDGIGFMVDDLTAILLHIPAGLVILAVAALAWWLQRSWRLAVFVIIANIVRAVDGAEIASRP